MIKLTDRFPSTWVNALLFVFFLAVWVVNVWKMWTGFGRMGFFDDASAMMCLVFGPRLLWETFSSVRGRVR